jgi:hypothetical protein
LLTGTCPVPPERDRRGQGAQYERNFLSGKPHHVGEELHLWNLLSAGRQKTSPLIPNISRIRKQYRLNIELLDDIGPIGMENAD